MVYPYRLCLSSCCRLTLISDLAMRAHDGGQAQVVSSLAVTQRIMAEVIDDMAADNVRFAYRSHASQPTGGS